MNQQPDLYHKAVSYYNQGNYRKARRYIDRVIKDDANHADALFLQGQIAYVAKHDLERAGKLISKAIALNPDASRYYLCLAVIDADRKQIPHAIQSLRQCLALAPEEQRAQVLLADAYRLQGRYEEAYRLYKGLQVRGELSPAGYFYLMYCLRGMPYGGYDPGLEQEIAGFLEQETLEHDRYGRYLCTLYRDKYRLDEPVAEVDCAVLARDGLFLRILKQITIRDPDLERCVTGVRRRLLIDCLENSALPGTLFELVIAIAIQGLNNEYVFHIDADEQQMIAALDDLIGLLLEQDQGVTQALLCAVMVLAMYQTPHDSRHVRALLAIPLQHWPREVRELLQRSLFDIADEIRRAAVMPALSAINDPTSLAVQSQYEANPYPRWIRLTHGDQSYSLREQVRMETTGTGPLPAYLDGKPVNVLVAGCGSGKQPLQLAKIFKNTEVVAVDLSRRSLAYAQRMAEEYAVKNVRFQQADILDLGQLSGGFHVIYCTGVLHHMREPLQGWRVLKQLLAPHGLMNIGLYSETARQAIVTVREFIARHGIQPAPDTIRAFRRGLMNGQLGEEVATDILKSNDFYAMSSCRDLLFHVQEQRFTLPRIKTILDQMGLRFLGFHFPLTEYLRGYQQTFPQDTELLDLDNWALFEQMHPLMFRNMYQFWCQAD